MLGEASQEECQMVLNWLSDAKSNMEYYAHLQQIWETSKHLASTSEVDENKAWSRFQLRQAGDTKVEHIAERRRFSWMKVAASVIVLLGLALAAFFIINQSEDSSDKITQSANSVLLDTLSDGSIVTLNKKSSIKYPSKFKGDKRSVSLQGEAFFDVMPNKKQPFVITVNDILVEVVGTSFNIKNENEITEIVVETGVVRVTKLGKTVELKAGERIVLNVKDSTTIKEKVSDKLYNYYRSKEFVCDNTPLWKLVEVLNESYEAEIVIGNKGLTDLRLNTTFNNESLDKVLEIIQLTFNISIVKKGKQIFLQ